MKREGGKQERKGEEIWEESEEKRWTEEQGEGERGEEGRRQKEESCSATIQTLKQTYFISYMFTSLEFLHSGGGYIVHYF